MALYEFFTSRNNSANAASFVGQAGRLFYDGANGVIKLSDGATPGGTFIPYNIASPTTVGGIKAGPGANVATDGTLTIDTTGLPLSIGNISIVDNTISAVNANDDLILESNGTGNVSLVGNILFHPTNGPTLADPFFVASSDGQVTFYTPASDPTSGAVKIIGTASGSFSMPVNTGVMLQLTGNNNDASRLYNDSVGSFAAFVGRRVNGTVASPSAVQAGDEIIRISSTGYNGNTIPGSGSARIVYQAKENYTTTAQGSNISIWATQLGTTTLSKIVTVDYESGLTATKANVVGNLTVNGTILPGDGNDIGSSTNRWGNIWLGPTAIHMQDTVAMNDVALQVTNGTLYLNGAQNISLGNLVIQDSTLKTITPDIDINLGELPDTGNVNLYRPMYVYNSSGNVTFNTDREGFVTIKTPTITTNQAGLMIIGSASGNIQPAGGSSTGRMVHITGNDGTTARVTVDAFGANAFASFVGRAARGTAASPTALQSGDVMMRFSATGWAEPGYNTTNTGGPPTSIDFVATDNYTHDVYGSAIKFYTSPQGNIGRNLSLTVASTGITTGNITAGNLALSGSFSGKYVRTIRDAGVIADGGTLTVDFSTDAIVYCTWANGMTLDYANYTAGRVVKVMATKATGSGVDTLNLDGVTASQTSTGTTTVNGTADTTTFIEITCIGTTLANVFIKL